MNDKELRIQSHRIFLQHNLNDIAMYHNEIKRLIRNEIVWINNKLDDPSTYPEKQKQLNIKKDNYINDYEQKLIQSTFVMMCSFLEEMLNIILTGYAADIKKPQSTGLDKYKLAFKDSYGVNISDFESWSHLKDLMKIRNCILHCNGNLTFLRDRHLIESVIERNADFTIKGKRIYIAANQLNRFTKSVDELKNWLLDRCVN